MYRFTEVFTDDKSTAPSAVSNLSGCRRTRARSRGVSLIEMLIVLCIIGIVSAIALPQLAASRRLVRSAAIPRQILTEMRLARQQALTQRQAFTVQYDDDNKQLVVINHRASGAALLDDPNYPQTANSIQQKIVSLADAGVNTGEIDYGLPASLPASARGSLDDGVNVSGLTNRQLNVTFQPNGSVIDRDGNPINKALFLYNNKAPEETAHAISILGAAGRVKSWHYNSDAKKYVE
jgi:prepilin-type N-terminal cleavage/methylation domain-containing protein